MSGAHQTIDRCRVCEKPALELFLDLGDQPHCNGLLTEVQLSEREPHYPLQVCFCRECTTVQLNYTVPKEVMFSEYFYVSGTTATLREHFRQSAARLVTNLQLKPDHLVVDIGSNDGTWLAAYRPFGLRALGVEPARNIAAIANEQGVETLNAFFNQETARQIVTSYGHPRLVTAAGVFFHLEELLSVTQGVADLIGSEGVFYVQAIYLGEMLRHNEFDNIYHEHLTYWTLRSLGHLFGRFGLEIFRADLLPIHGGSLELYVAKQGTHPIDESVRRMLAEEAREGFGELHTYKQFAERVWQIGDQLTALLEAEAKAGRTVFAFGAPAKGATLLNTFKLTAAQLPCATEKNPLKVGKYIPGCRIPIVSEDSVEDPGAYLMLPWNFAKEFVRIKMPYLQGGGAFLVPIPWPHRIDRDNHGRYAS